MYNVSLDYRFGTHVNKKHGRCYCIQKKIDYFGNYTTIFETDDKDVWTDKCNYYLKKEQWWL